MTVRVTEQINSMPNLHMEVATPVIRPTLTKRADFRVVPRLHVNSPEGLLWRIVLSPYLDSVPILPLEIRDDAVVGLRTPETPSVDVDLKKWGAYSLGVSRRHLCLRPTSKRLYIFDLSSTNGTYLNGVLLTPSRAQTLNDGDVLTLGHMHIGVSLMARPHTEMMPQ